MLKRIFQISNELESSIFLFGARQTGKTTILHQQFPNAILFDLLDTNLRSRLSRRPALLFETLRDKPEGTLIIIDEIPEVPELLNEIHRLIVERQLIFILCGSSARKLKRKGHNTLGGRALPVNLYPLVSTEIPNFDIDRAVTYGMIPSHYLARNPARLLAGYIDVYLKEEIKEEALVRNLDAFHRFLEVNAYFDILEDTLIGYRIPAYTKVMQRRLVQAPRFYYFDIGITNHLLHRKELVRGTPEYGHAFEHLVMQELIAWLHYTHIEEKLSYWRTYTGIEVDAIIGDARVAIEIKSTEEIQSKHLKNLRIFAQEHPQSRLIVVSLDIFTRRIDKIECLHVMDFFHQLWNEGL